MDEDIFDMGERKSKLTEAVLRDNSGAGVMEDEGGEEEKTDKTKKGKDKKSSEEGLVDIGTIGRILQKALQRLTR